MVNLSYFKLNDVVKDPVFATVGSACFDVYAHFNPLTPIKLFTAFNKEIKTMSSSFEPSVLRIQRGDRALVPTGLIFDIPTGYSLRLHIRSSLALKHGLSLANSEAVIDSDYFHETFMLLENKSESTVEIHSGDRIVQGELVKTLDYELCHTFEKPTQTTGRVGGIGSTGTI